VPLFVTNALAGEPLPMYGDGMQVRDWLHVADHAAGIDFVLRNGQPGEAYNLPGGTELANREVISRLLAATGRDWTLVRTVPDRPGHDRRYAMDGSKVAALGWSPVVPFDGGLAATIAWYRDNPAWVASARSGDWDSYYERQYGDRLEAGREVVDVLDVPPATDDAGIIQGG
jgi:dTDP-glucose 4,6-dehydratase